MWGRPARTLYAVFSSPLPGKESEYHRWYEELHVPDSLSLGVFHSAHRYAALAPTRADYLTLWESEDADVASALERVRPAAESLRARGRIWPVQRVVFHQFLALEEGPMQANGARAVAVLTTLQNCWAAPRSDAAFRDWYRKLAHEPGLLEAYHSHYRYAHARDARTLVLLESAHDAARLEPLWRGRGERGPTPFGEPTPIFRGGAGPQQYAPPEHVGDEQLARWLPAWIAHWRPLAR